MKRLFALLVVLTAIGCQKETIDYVDEIQGSWYGSVGKHPLLGDEQYIRLCLNDYVAELSPYFSRYDGGWHEAKGTYRFTSKDTITFNLDLGKCDTPNEATITPKYGVLKKSASTSEVGKEVFILQFFYDREYPKGTITSNYLWLDRERPSLSPN